MKNLASQTGGRVAISAAVTSLALALFVPYGHPWASLAWAVLACAAAVWAVRGSIAPVPSMSDVIRGVESESPQRRAERKIGLDAARGQL